MSEHEETEAQRIAREVREAQDQRERELLEEQWAMPEKEPNRVRKAQRRDLRGGVE